MGRPAPRLPRVLPAAATSARLESPAPAPTVLPGSKAAERGSSPGPTGAAAADTPASPAAAGARDVVSESARRDRDLKPIDLPKEVPSWAYAGLGILFSSLIYSALLFIAANVAGFATARRRC